MCTNNMHLLFDASPWDVAIKNGTVHSTVDLQTRPADLVLAALPAAATLLLWVIFENSNKARVFTPNMILFAKGVALVCTVAQCLLVYRMFEVFACEGTFASPMNWVALPVATVAFVNILFVFALARRYPRVCSSFVLALATACVVGEYVGRAVLETSAVAYLIPLQQFTCVILVTFLTNPRRAVPLPTSTRRAATSKTGTTMMTIDPLQRREEDPRSASRSERRCDEGAWGWSWWA